MQLRIILVTALLVGAGVTSKAARPAVAVTRVASGTSAAAAPHITHELMPVAGSARYLVYTKFPAVSRNPPQLADGGLFVLTKRGVPRRLGTVTNASGSFSLAGHTLIYIWSDGTGENFRRIWVNLKTGARGRIAKAQYPYTAAPDGWVTGKEHYPEPAVLYDHAVNGRARSLGSPFKDSNIRSPFSASHYLVSYSVTNDEHANGRLRIMDFDRPGVWHTLIPALRNAYVEDYDCSSATSHYVACQTPVQSPEGGDEARLIPVDGSPGLQGGRAFCVDGLVAVMGNSAAWPGCDGKFTVLSAGNKVEVSEHRFRAPMIPAFGQLAVATWHQQKIELVSSVHGKPKVLVRV